MNYEEEMRYRKELLSRVRDGKKITPNDRLWLQTHKVINRLLGYPYLNTDIICLQPKVNYLVRVKIETLAYSNRIIPVITVPGGKGKIIPYWLLLDGKKVETKKPVKMLGLILDLSHNQAEITYQSDLGLLGVSYECDYFDDKQHLMIRQDSNTGNATFAMLSEVLADNKILYRCKVPDTNNFESFAFSIEWETVTDEHS